MNAFCCSVNVDGVVILLGGGADTSTLHVEPFQSEAVGTQKPCTLLPFVVETLRLGGNPTWARLHKGERVQG